MDLLDIQHAIEALPAEQQKALRDWFTEWEGRQWDAEIERDFSPGGAGMELMDRVKAQVERGESVPMSKRPLSHR